MLCILGIVMLVVLFGGMFCLIGFVDNWKTAWTVAGIIAAVLATAAWVVVAFRLIETYCK